MPEMQDKIEDAIHTIIHCWSMWEGEARQEQQQSQNWDDWYDAMSDQLRAVLEGMVSDELQIVCLECRQVECCCNDDFARAIGD